METLDLIVEARTTVGKNAARRLRSQEKIPAILYARKRKPIPLSVPAKEFRKKVTALEGAHLIRLRANGVELGECVALVKEVQLHPVTHAVLHVDFLEVDLTQKLTVSAPLHFVGRAAGVALGGILQPLRREISVRCLPMQIPEFIEVDVSALGIHDAIHVSELRLPEGVEAIYTEDFAVVTVLPPTVAETKPTAAEAPETAATAEEAKTTPQK